MEEWLSITSWPIVNCLAICSDESVTRGTDSIVLNPDECDFPVTTDAVEVHKFLKKERTGITLIFCTYHSSNVLAEGMRGAEPFEFGVFDEAHKTAGHNGFGLALTDNHVPIQKRLFMTATPRHYDIYHENKAGDAKLVFSMDNEALYGKRAYTFSFRRAMELGVIVNYKIIISITESKGGLNQEPEIEEKIVALQKAIQKMPHLSKIITFHKTIEEAHHFSKHLKDQNTLPNFKSLHVSSLIPANMRKSAMDQFSKSKFSLISNARCLTEGIDTPAVDMVAFLNKKRSKVDIIQAIGRALRRSPGKKYGYVFLPLFIEKTNGESLEHAIERAGYQEIWDVLQALSEYDKNLEDHINHLRQEKGKLTKIRKGLESYLEIIVNDTVNLRLQKALSKKIDIIIIDKIGDNWHEMYGKLIKFKQENDHCNVPKTFPNDPVLSNWVTCQRLNYKKHKLPSEKIKLLEDIQFKWAVHASQWRRIYDRLVKFYQKNGHSNVPAILSHDQLLANWVRVQRKAYNANKLSLEKIKLLNSVDFVWRVLDTEWKNAYDNITQFKKKHNHFRVSEVLGKDCFLDGWVSLQRRLYELKKLPLEKIQLLETIGFNWTPRATQWQKMYEKLAKFKEKHGHIIISMTSPEEYQLSKWTTTQRQNHKKGKLDKTRIKLLESIGFSFEPINKHWEDMYKKLIHLMSNGKSIAPQGSTLNRWIIHQRKLFKIGELSPEKIKLLNNIKFTWEPSNQYWERMYQQLVQYNNDPNKAKKNLKLSKWVDWQKNSYKKKKLSSERIKLLESAGFEWDSHHTYWQKMYEKLTQFKKEHHHCHVPQEFQQDPQLGKWVNIQRQTYKKQRLSLEKIQKLEAVGFAWDSTETPWQQMFDKLLQFKKEYHHCNVSWKFQQDLPLARWVRSQRYLHKKHLLSVEKTQKLEAISFEWQPHNVQWQQMFDKLLQFKKEYHHSNVPWKFQQDLPLANWISTQRHAYKKQELSLNKLQQLEAIGFEWDPIETQWQQMFDKLLQFKKEYHHSNVPNIFPQDPSLASWVRNQRHVYKKHQLSLEKIQKLEDLCFEWEPQQAQWQQMFDKLFQFKQEYHHCNVPYKFQQDPSLVSWVNHQRHTYKKHLLSHDRIKQLETLGFQWFPKK